MLNSFDVLHVWYTRTLWEHHVSGSSIPTVVVTVRCCKQNQMQCWLASERAFHL